jgi:pyruvate formate lyase activating enzyme
LVLDDKPLCISEDDIKSFLERSKKNLTSVVLTGGEFLNQSDAIDYIKYIKSLGYKVKIDTNGCNYDKLKYLIDNKLVDYVAMDIKSRLSKYKNVIGRELTKVEEKSICDCVELLLEDKVDYEFRTTVAFPTTNIVDFIDISKWVSGAKKYVIQEYTLCDGVINRDLLNVPRFELHDYKKILEMSVKEVIIKYNKT